MEKTKKKYALICILFFLGRMICILLANIYRVLSKGSTKNFIVLANRYILPVSVYTADTTGNIL